MGAGAYVTKWCEIVQKAEDPDPYSVKAATLDARFSQIVFRITLNIVQIASVHVKKTGNPKCWKAMLTNATGCDEGVFTIVGVLQEKDLPPIRSGGYVQFRPEHEAENNGL